MRFLLALVCVCASACAVSSRQAPELAPAADGGGPAADATVLAPEDPDHDGLCNETEKDVHTDPDALDTDRDGYPDLVEVMAEHDPLDPQSPGLDQVGFLVAKRDAELDFEARVTVDGMGEGYTGLFTAYAALNAAGLTAGDFLERGSALSAEPPDNVRDLDATRERFGVVVGRTRLAFRLRFAFKRAVMDFPCADTFPFTYGVKDDLGRRGETRDYLLVVVPEGSTGLDPKAFCIPTECL